jgi:hypothetical protein
MFWFEVIMGGLAGPILASDIPAARVRCGPHIRNTLSVDAVADTRGTVERRAVQATQAADALLAWMHIWPSAIAPDQLAPQRSA